MANRAYRLAYVTKSGTLEPVNVCNANAKKAMAKIGLAMIAAPALESVESVRSTSPNENESRACCRQCGLHHQRQLELRPAICPAKLAPRPQVPACAFFGGYASRLTTGRVPRESTEGPRAYVSGDCRLISRSRRTVERPGSALVAELCYVGVRSRHSPHLRLHLSELTLEHTRKRDERPVALHAGLF